MFLGWDVRVSFLCGGADFDSVLLFRTEALASEGDAYFGVHTG